MKTFRSPQCAGQLRSWSREESYVQERRGSVCEAEMDFEKESRLEHLSRQTLKESWSLGREEKKNYAVGRVWNRASGMWWRDRCVPNFVQVPTGKQWVKLSQEALTIVLMVLIAIKCNVSCSESQKNLEYVLSGSSRFECKYSMGQN